MWVVLFLGNWNLHVFVVWQFVANDWVQVEDTGGELAIWNVRRNSWNDLAAGVLFHVLFVFAERSLSLTGNLNFLHDDGSQMSVRLDGFDFFLLVARLNVDVAGV